MNSSVLDVHEVRARSDAGASRPIGLLVIAAVAVVVFVCFAVVVWHGRRPIGLDDLLGGSVGLRSQTSALHRLAGLGSVRFVIPALAVVAVVAAVRRDAVAVALCAIGPALAGLCVLVAKPTVDRLRGSPYSPAYSYPSGHVTLAAALGTVVVVVAYRLGGARAAAIAAVVATLLTFGVSVAVVRLGWHYPTDAIGGAALGVGVVCGTYAALTVGVGKIRRTS